jgi:hypothetical protein
MNLRRVVQSVAMIAALGVVTSSTGVARATDVQDCTVGRVRWYKVSDGTLQMSLNCGGTNYDVRAYGADSNADCNVSLQTREAWMRLGEAALLSGRHVNATYNSHSCGGSTRKVISFMSIEAD